MKLLSNIFEKTKYGFWMLGLLSFLLWFLTPEPLLPPTKTDMIIIIAIAFNFLMNPPNTLDENSP